MQRNRQILKESDLQKMLDYLEDAPRRDKIDLVRDILAPRLSIMDEEFALEVFDEVIAPVLAEDIRKDIRALNTN